MDILFSTFLNCINDAKSRKAFHIKIFSKVINTPLDKPQKSLKSVPPRLLTSKLRKRSDVR